MEALDTKRKALKINLDERIYGSFAEIGAGQEVARNFFTAGAASGTIAKTMSAYDMAFSNAIYGKEEGGRYVSRSRVLKMLEHEYPLLEERLVEKKYENKTFFAFADTVTTLNYNKDNDPHGWLGIQFQLIPRGPSNTILFHVRLLDTDSGLQQQVLGALGVNLIYAAYYYSGNYQEMIESLVDNLQVHSVEIDLIQVEGPDFPQINNRLLNLYLIAKGYSHSVVFTPDGYIHQAKDYLYKKDIILFRIKANHTINPIFEKEDEIVRYIQQVEGISHHNLDTLFEITLDDTKDKSGHEADLMSLVEKIDELTLNGKVVFISQYARHHNLVGHISRFKPRMVRILISARKLAYIFNASNYEDHYLNELLNYISHLFNKEVRLYVFSEKSKENELLSLDTIPVGPESKPLFDFLVQNNYLKELLISKELQ